ncbi:MAG: mnmE [Nevskia sp.]|nr:mnmE [Nevskia sp.]
MTLAADTIVAIATAAGRAGVGMIRISGPQARRVAETIAGPVPQPRMASLRRFRRSDATVLDEGLLLYFPGPHSFTGEDVVELQAHGSPIALAEIVEALCLAGARMAQPGEFSERAFLNGRMDLAQAEAVADLIDASSRAAARAATRSVQGEFSQCIEGAVESLIQLRVLLEAALDFADEEVPAASPAAVRARLEVIATELRAVQHAAAQGRRLREGMRVAIAGRPNVGKSTLLNRLAGTEAAIVSPQAGTTRDVLREHIVIDGLPLTIVDTAGLRESEDAIEREGVRRAQTEIAQAELVLLVIDDRSNGDDATPEQLLPWIDKNRNLQTLIVRNKCDLSGVVAGPDVDQQGGAVLRVSAATGAGFDALVAALKHAAGLDDSGAQIYSARARHLEALQDAQLHLQAALKRSSEHFDAVLIAEELRLAQQALEAITGKFSSEDLLGRIFATFCLGK